MSSNFEEWYPKVKTCNSQQQFHDIIQNLTSVILNDKLFTMILLKFIQYQENDKKLFIQISENYITNNPIESFQVIRTFFINLSQNKRQSANINLDNLSRVLFIVDFHISINYFKVLQLQSREIDDLITQLFSLPNVIRNIFKNHEKIKLYEERFHQTIINNLIDSQSQLSSEMVEARQINLLTESLYLVKDFTFMSAVFNQESLIYKRKLLSHLILRFIQKSDNLISKLLIQSYWIDSDLKQAYIDVVNSSELGLTCFPVLTNIIKDSCNDTLLQDILIDLVIKWSDPEFSKYASKGKQYNTTNMIASLLDLNKRKTFAKLDTLILLINDGIQLRLNFFQNFNYIRVSGLVVWRHLVSFLDIEQTSVDKELHDELDIPEFLVENDVKQEKEPEPQEEVIEFLEIKRDIQIDEEFMSLDYSLEDNEGLPKSIYDSLMALQNGNIQRIKLALQHLPYLIRKNLSDVQIYSEQLTNILLKLHHDDSWQHSFDQQRKDILVSLLIIATKNSANTIIERFFSDECSMGEKHLILLTLIDAVDELSNNPQKYPVHKFNEYTQETNQTFFFQKVSTKYYQIENQEEAEMLQRQQRKDRVDEKSRRWGQTRKQHEYLTRQDLLITAQNKEATYENRFHGLLEYIFFPVIINAQTKLRLLFVREPLLLTHFFQMCTKMLDCAKFSFDLYKMIDECADLTALIKQNKNMQVLRSKLQMWLKVSVLVKQEVILEHPLLIEKIMKLLESFNCHEVREMHDPQTRTILGMIFENFKNLLQIKLLCDG